MHLYFIAALREKLVGGSSLSQRSCMKPSVHCVRLHYYVVLRSLLFILQIEHRLLIILHQLIGKARKLLRVARKLLLLPHPKLLVGAIILRQPMVTRPHQNRRHTKQQPRRSKNKPKPSPPAQCLHFFINLFLTS